VIAPLGSGEINLNLLNILSPNWMALPLIRVNSAFLRGHLGEKKIELEACQNKCLSALHREIFRLAPICLEHTCKAIPIRNWNEEMFAKSTEEIRRKSLP
jgi:hypothetical protein